MAVVAAGIVVFRRLSSEIQYLLLHASYERNLWSPPKGHVDPGESEFETALRETEEEAGIQKAHLNILMNFTKTLNYEVRGKPKRVVYWVAELCDPNRSIILSDEHIDFKWQALSEAQNTVRFPDMQNMLFEINQFLTKRISENKI